MLLKLRFLKDVTKLIALLHLWDLNADVVESGVLQRVLLNYFRKQDQN